MELIPQIADAIYYILGTLVLVLCFSYIFLKLSNRDNDAKDKLSEKRKYIRQYIINQNQYITSNSSAEKNKLAPNYYSEPSYSSLESPQNNSGVRNKQIPLVLTDKKTTTNNGSTKTDKRYSIINKMRENEPSIPHINQSARSFYK